MKAILGGQRWFGNVLTWQGTMRLPMSDRVTRRALIVIAVSCLAAGAVAWLVGQGSLAAWLWTAGTIPVIAGLAVSMARDLMSGRMGVDPIAFLSMSAAILLGQPLAGIVVAVMYAGGNVLEDFAVARAERDLKSLVDRAPRVAHQRLDTKVKDIGIEDVRVGDILIARAGEVIPVDGIVAGESATVDESALTGEPIPVTRTRGQPVHSGTINAGQTFDLRATAVAGESTYAASYVWSPQRKRQSRLSFVWRIATLYCFFRSRSSSLEPHGCSRAIRYGGWRCSSPQHHVRLFSLLRLRLSQAFPRRPGSES